MKNTIFLLLIILSVHSNAQQLPKDTLYGKVKKIREKVLFLTKKENPQLLYYDDYGHSGFSGPKNTIVRFYNTWYKSEGCYYINYERYFNGKGQVIKDIWYSKKDSLFNTFRYLYDTKGRLISLIDSTEWHRGTENHYFSDYKNWTGENIIHESMPISNFSHVYNEYENGKIILTKTYQENGFIEEYKTFYNEKGKVAHRVTVNPFLWKKGEGNSWSLGVQDSIKMFKNMEFEYDEKGRITKKQHYNIQDYTNNIIPGRHITNIYNSTNLLTTISGYGMNGKLTYEHFRYDNKNRLIEQYCCDEKPSDASVIQKYSYLEDKVVKLLYTERADYNPKKLITYKITYRYKFDSHNNWTEIIKNVDGKDLYKWVREITYY